MLVHLYFSLRAAHAAPSPTPYEVYAAFLRHIGHHDTALLRRLRGGEVARPFATALLEGDTPGSWRVAWSSVDAALTALLLHTTEEPFAMRLGEADYTARRDWTPQRATFDGLAEGATGARRLRLDFHTPTTFRVAGRDVPLPVPDLLFRAVEDKWRRFAPPSLQACVPERGDTWPLWIRRCEVSTRKVYLHEVPGKAGMGARVGFVGRVDVETEAAHGTLLHLLGGLAVFTGIGSSTSYGMGGVECCPSHALQKS